MLNFLLNLLNGDRKLAGSREEKESTPHVIDKKEDSVIIPHMFRDDVKALKEEFGEDFCSGKTLTLSLTRALEIMPRKRQRTDAYTLLTRWLSETLDITLTLKSRKSK